MKLTHKPLRRWVCQAVLIPPRRYDTFRLVTGVLKDAVPAAGAGAWGKPLYYLLNCCCQVMLNEP